MANVAHSTLTGANLHEPKGVAAAASGRVYVSDGAGSGSWTATSTIPGVFGSQYAWFQDEKTSGTFNSDLSLNSTWQIRTLNTTKANVITSASLSSNLISLPAGTYYIDARTPVNIVADQGIRYAKSKLFNATDSTDVIIGGAIAFESNNQGVVVRGTSWCPVQGWFTLNSTKSLGIYSICNTFQSVVGQGIASTPEVYTQVYIWKTA